MVKAASGPESPFETAFNDLIEVIPELAELEMYTSNAQIVPGREASPDTLLSKAHGLEEAQLYGSETNLTMIKEEPSEGLSPCNFTNHPISAWLSASMFPCHPEQDPFITRRHERDSRDGLQWLGCDAMQWSIKQESMEQGDKMLLERTQTLVQANTPDPRDYFVDIGAGHRNPAMTHVINNHLASDPEPSWFGPEDPFSTRMDNNELSEISSDPCLSEYSSDTEQHEIKPKVGKFDYSDVIDKHEKIWFGTASPHPPKVEKVTEHKREGRKTKTTFKTGRPRLCQFLIELLSKPDRYSHLIEWIDEDKGIFKFINSTKVAREWGQRRNKPMMKYENFARSLRTYIAKGILTKPRSKLVYRFTN